MLSPTKVSCIDATGGELRVKKIVFRVFSVQSLNFQ